MAWGDFWKSMALVRDSQQQKGLYDLGREANAAFGQSVQDPGLFQGAQPGAMPMPGGPPPGTSDAYAYGGPPGQNVPPQGAPPPQQSPFQRPQFGYGQGGQTSKFDQPLYTPVAATMQRYAQDGINSIGGIAQRWAQENGSDAQPVVAFLSRTVGAAPDAPLTPDQRMAVAKGISLFDFQRGRPPAAGMQPPGPTPGMMAPQGPPQGFAGAAGQPGSGAGLMQPIMTGMPMSGQRVGPSTVAMTTPGFSGGSPPPPSGGGAAGAGSPLPPAAPADTGQPPQGGAPPTQVAANGGIDMNRIIAAVQRANPNARPEVVGAVVKQFLPILTGERAQGNSDRTFAAGRSDEMYNRGVTERAYNTGRADKEYERDQPFAVQPGVDYVSRKTGETVYSGRDKPGMNASGKPDAGTMKAIREADSSAEAAKQAIEALNSVITPDASGQSLNDKAKYGLLAGPRGYIGSLTDKGKGSGTATEVLTNRITGNALTQLKLIFGGNPTEGERKVLLDITGSVNQSPEVRKEIYSRAAKLAQDRLDFYKQQAEEMRGGSYYKPRSGGGTTAPGAGRTVIDGVTIERLP